MRTVRAAGRVASAAKTAASEMTASAAHVPAATAAVLRECSGGSKQQDRRGESRSGKLC
jgi:hypothetical protein